MKKVLFVMIASLFLTATADAQLFQIGVKGGVNFSQLAMDDITGIQEGGDVYDLITGDMVTGYQVGLQSRINVAAFFVQPELYFNAVKGSVEKVVDGGANAMLDVEFNRFDIPLLVGVKLGPARINAGPVGSAVVSSVNDLKEIDPALESLSNNFTWGFQAGVGVDLFKKLSIDARYEGSLTKFGESFAVGEQDFTLDARPRQIIVAVGYWF